MNRIKTLAIALVVAASSSGVSAEVATQAIKNDLDSRMRQVNMPEWFAIFDRDLTPEQRDALTVLYAYMPLTDMADNSGDYFLKNVDMSLKARRELPWGKTVPDREFRHFVLPVRVNNERLDNHREIFYNELKDRIKDLSMADAILEVNHWCHEKATYEPSDGRTHSPEATCYTAIGRCGEESTFTVAALRSVGIPARQVYTPRWAHTDDNHAWVEAWADGQWYFLGACEPEPVLDLGWFNASAARGMLMHTRVFGNYDGPEEVADRPSGYTEINVTEKYAPTDTLHVEVVDAQGKPVADATVSYCIFNYCEFYPAVVKKADSEGKSSLSTGLGDLIVWATDGTNFGFEKAAVGKDKTLTVALTRNSEPVSLDWDIVPPPVRHAGVEVSEAMAAENNRRKAYEDSIRGAYTATFMTPEQAAALAAELGLDAERLAPLMADARGNHKVIADFLRQAPAADRLKALMLVESLLPKDRSDIPMANLLDHFTTPWSDSPLYQEYILNPRVDVEELVPYREYFVGAIPADKAAEYRADPSKWVKWVADNIDTSLLWIPGNVRMSPITVYEKRRTNRSSRNVFFVSAARAMGIPARVDPVTNKTQWADSEGRWIDAVFETPKAEAGAQAAQQQGTLILDFTQTSRIDDPKYYWQFTVSKIENGRPQMLGYPEDGTWSTTFAQGQQLDPGQYIITSGQRLADGGVLSHIETVEIRPGETVRRPLIVRNDDSQVQVIGSFNAETPYHDLADNTDRNIIATTGRGYYIIGLIKPGHEPSNHVLRDLAPYNTDFEKWGHKIMLFFANEDEASRFDSSMLPKLPDTVVYGTDINGVIRDSLIEDLKLPSADMPIFVIADTFNRVVFVSQGYTIGLGEKLIDTIWRLAE